MRRTTLLLLVALAVASACSDSRQVPRPSNVRSYLQRMAEEAPVLTAEGGSVQQRAAAGWAAAPAALALPAFAMVRRP